MFCYYLVGFNKMFFNMGIPTWQNEQVFGSVFLYL